MSRAVFWMAAGAVAVVIASLVLGAQTDGDWTGADGQAAALIERDAPSYTPWAAHLWKPPSAEVESMLFALQAACGAFAIGYLLGRLRGRGESPAPAAPQHSP